MTRLSLPLQAEHAAVLEAKAAKLAAALEAKVSCWQ